MTSQNEYYIASWSYLERARLRLEDRKHESLFYAAYELRCFVEKRQSEYLEAQREYIKSIPKHWKLAHQKKELQKIYDTKKIQRLRWVVDQKNFFEMHYVPISDELLKITHQSDKLRHAQINFYPSDDKSWKIKRKKLINFYQLCWLNHKGNLLCPALKDKEGLIGEIKLQVTLLPGQEKPDIFKNGLEGKMQVEYLDNTPKEWICDIEE